MVEVGADGRGLNKTAFKSPDFNAMQPGFTHQYDKEENDDFANKLLCSMICFQKCFQLYWKPPKMCSWHKVFETYLWWCLHVNTQWIQIKSNRYKLIQGNWSKLRGTEIYIIREYLETNGAISGCMIYVDWMGWMVSGWGEVWSTLRC